MILKMTRQRALELGLLACECGCPENNHFADGKGPCARCQRSTCPKYRERGRRGVQIVKVGSR